MRGVWMAMAGAGVLLLSGCIVQMESERPVPASGIAVRIVNETDQPLDPQVYVGPVSEGVRGLFERRYKRTDFGVGGIGVLLGNSDAVLTIACDGEVLIATSGGVYGDDLNAPAGEGQQVVLEQGLNVQCGDTVTFRFQAVGGALRTSYSVSPG